MNAVETLKSEFESRWKQHDQIISALEDARKVAFIQQDATNLLAMKRVSEELQKISKKINRLPVIMKGYTMRAYYENAHYHDESDVVAIAIESSEMNEHGFPVVSHVFKSDKDILDFEFPRYIEPILLEMLELVLWAYSFSPIPHNIPISLTDWQRRMV